MKSNRLALVIALFAVSVVLILLVVIAQTRADKKSLENQYDKAQVELSEFRKYRAATDAQVAKKEAALKKKEGELNTKQSELDNEEVQLQELSKQLDWKESQIDTVVAAATAAAANSASQKTIWVQCVDE